MEALFKTWEELGLGLYVACMLAGFEAAAHLNNSNNNSDQETNSTQAAQRLKANAKTTE